ncbi:hypothetical protein ACHAXS_007632, partial [Conticribra weissflogii]
MVEETGRPHFIVIRILHVKNRSVLRGIHPLAHEMIDCSACFPKALIAIVGAEHYQEANAGDQNSDAVGMIQVVVVISVFIHVSAISGGVPLQLDGEEEENGDDSNKGPLVQSGTMDPEKKVQAVDAFEVVDHFQFRRFNFQVSRSQSDGCFWLVIHRT